MQSIQQEKVNLTVKYNKINTKAPLEELAARNEE